MIGIAGIYGSQEGHDYLNRILTVHETQGVKLVAPYFRDDRMAACTLMREEIAFYEKAGCRYEDDDYVFLLEGMLALCGPLSGISREEAGKEICKLWKNGLSFLSYLNGEYVFLIYNKKNSVLTIANDRFGVRPFFYSLSEGVLRFGSEIKSILATGIRADLDNVGLMEFFTFSHNTGERSIFKQVKALRPASVLRFDQSGLELRTYWKLGFSGHDRILGVRRLMRETADALRDGAARKLDGRRHLGMGLSGGLDSRLIADLIPTDNRPVFARTYGMSDSDEVKTAKQIASKLELEHFVHQPSEVQLFSFLHPSVWRTECRVNFTGLKSIIEHGQLKDKFWYNLPGHFGDVLSGKQLRPFMFYPYSRNHFIEKLYNHYTRYTYGSEEILRSIFTEDFFINTLPKVKHQFKVSFDSIDTKNNWDLYDVWDLTNRQPMCTFASSAVDNYLFGKAILLTDYNFVDTMLRVPGIYRFGQVFYKTMIAKHFPEISGVPNVNTGKQVSRWMLKNGFDLYAQYSRSQLNRKREAIASGGKADLFRRDSELRNWLLTRIEGEDSLKHIFSLDGVLRAVHEHYEQAKDRSYILGVLATFLAAYEMFFKGEVDAMPAIARPTLD
jgi:hypothetical protein